MSATHLFESIEVGSAQAAEARRAATITLVVIFLLMVAKAVAGYMVQSIAIGSEALHTLLDLATAALAWFTIRAAQAPPDEDHPYGHGKVENLMALIQALMIMLPAVGIAWFSARELLLEESTFVVEQTAIGLWVMGITMVVNLGLMLYLNGVAKRTGSPSIVANAKHERVDLVTSAVVFVGLAAIGLTGYTIIDPILGLLAAIYIFWEGWELLYDSAQVLLDRQAPKQVIDRIHAVLHRHGNFILQYSNVRTRLLGSQVFADVDIQVCRDASLGEVHDLTDHLEEEFRSAIPGIDIHIHPEPCPVAEHLCPLKNGSGPLFTPVHAHTSVPQELKEAEREVESEEPIVIA